MDDPVVIWALVAVVALFFVQLCNVALAEDRRVRRPKAGACTACGYELVDRLCPECGPAETPHQQRPTTARSRHMFGPIGVAFTGTVAALLVAVATSDAWWSQRFYPSRFTSPPGTVGDASAQFSLVRPDPRTEPTDILTIEFQVDDAVLAGTALAEQPHPFDWPISTDDGETTTVRSFLQEQRVGPAANPLPDHLEQPVADPELRDLLRQNMLAMHPLTAGDQHPLDLNTGRLALGGGRPGWLWRCAVVILPALAAAAMLRWIAVKIGRSGIL